MKNKITQFLKTQNNVQFAYLFGSCARDEADERSDVDIAVYVEQYSLDEYLALHHNLTKLLHKDVDLTILNNVKNIYLLENILLEGKVLKDYEDRAYYEVMGMHQVIDYKNFRKYIDAA